MNTNEAIQHAAKLLHQGKLVAIPTETVYGLAADAKNETAISKVYTVKGRPKGNPLIIHLSDIEAITAWARHIPDEAFQLAERFWPGPLTLILERQPWVSPLITGNQDTVGLRIPNHPLTLALLREFDGGLAAPSANRYRRISPTQKAHVEKELGDAVDYILDGGPCSVGIESTIVYCLKGKEIQILRQGAITAEDLEKVLGKKILQKSHVSESEKEEQEKGDHTIMVPGSDIQHYAPEKPLYGLETQKLFSIVKQFVLDNKTVSVISFQEKPTYFLDHHGVWVTTENDAKDFAKNLYALLHQLDKNETEVILIEIPPKNSAWEAVRDRLQRASRKS
jgi:L-threonylcarbamoyladenylate synthase